MHAVRLPAEVWAWLRASAERHGWSLDAEVEWAIREHCAALRQGIPLAHPARPADPEAGSRA
jgi:hypothetical protein